MATIDCKGAVCKEEYTYLNGYVCKFFLCEILHMEENTLSKSQISHVKIRKKKKIQWLEYGIQCFKFFHCV